MTEWPNTDKVEGGFLPVYQDLAAQIGPAGKVCELGVYEGESLLLWQRLFPEGTVTGVDMDERAYWPAGCRKVVMKQEDPRLAQILALGGPYDLIVDDASHKGDCTAPAFWNLWPLVAAGGCYVIEDWMIGLPAFQTHDMYDPGMLRFISSLPGRLLKSRDSDVAQITYQYGLVVVHKRGG